LTSYVIRGGSWISSNPDYFRAAFRYGHGPDLRSLSIGFRIALGLQRRF